MKVAKKRIDLSDDPREFMRTLLPSRALLMFSYFLVIVC